MSNNNNSNNNPSEVAYWAERWKDGRTGFHEGSVNSFLEKHLVERLGTHENKRVLVPLCGKAEDIIFLASHGYGVVGIEGVEEPVKELFAEHQLAPTIRDVRPGIRSYSAGKITIFVGDFFAITKEDIGHANALYDRAAIVALPPDTLSRYVAHLNALLDPQSPAIVITFEYPQTQMEGPPFSVGEYDLRRHFGDVGARSVELIGHAPASSGARFREAGVNAIERCFHVKF